MSDNCIFCKIANGAIPSKTIYEDDYFRVILDLGPATKGHALILPKKHYENLFAMPDELLQKAIVLAKKIGLCMQDKLGSEGFNIIQNNGELGGQTVFHFHIHLIPRYKNDHQMIGWNAGNPSQEELEEIRNLLVE